MPPFILQTPFFIVVLSMAAGSYVGFTFDVPFWIIALIFGVASLVLYSVGLRQSRSIRRNDILFLLFVSLFVFGGQAYHASLRRVVWLEGDGGCRMRCTVVRVNHRDSLRSSFVVETDSISCSLFSSQSSFRGMVSLEGRGADVRCGSSLAVNGVFSDPFIDPFGGFDYKAYLQSQGCSFFVRADSAGVLGSSFSLSSVVGAVQEWFYSSLRRCGVGEENTIFLRALILADRSELSAAVRQAFADCGTQHVMAVSGLHVCIISMFITWLLRFFFNVRIVAVASIILLWFYAILVGLSPSIIRACVMFSFFEGRWILGRHIGSFHALSAALFFILLFDPSSVYSVGMWLSFSAVGALVGVDHLFSAIGDGRHVVLRWLLRALIVTLVAQIATTPFSLYVFHNFPLYFWLNNLFVVPAVEYIIIGGLVTLVFSWVPFVGLALGWLTDHALSLLIWYTRSAASLPFAVWRDVPFGVTELMVSLLLVICIVLCLRSYSVVRLRLLCGFALLFLFVIVVGSVRSMNRSGVVVYSSGRSLCVAMVDHGCATHLLSDTTLSSVRRAVVSINRSERYSDGGVLLAGNGFSFSCDSLCYYYCSLPQGAMPDGTDICFVGADVYPEEIYRQGVSYYVAGSNAFAELWRRRYPNVVIIDDGEKLFLDGVKE